LIAELKEPVSGRDAMHLRDFDIVIVGAGFYGLTIVERAANVLGRKVCVLERRTHFGGNCFSETDSETGIEYHKYGSHLFHTNSEEIWEYLHNFTQFTSYRHKVVTGLPPKNWSSRNGSLRVE
jgi:UDP-galactopyranose mutase